MSRALLLAIVLMAAAPSPLWAEEGTEVKAVKEDTAVKEVKEETKCPSKAQHFLNIGQLSTKGVGMLVERALKIKKRTKSKTQLYVPFEGMMLGMIFTKPSLRTRASFESGFHRLGGGSSFFTPADIALGKREAIKDVARVMSRFYNAIVARVHEHKHLEELACYSDVPVVNALSNYNHPLQIMSDLLTITEHFNSHETLLQGKKWVYIGDCNNMVTSMLYLAARTPFTLGIACPKTLDAPDAEALKVAQDANISKIIVSNEPRDVMDGADVVYADVWTSMGFKEQQEERLSHFKGWTIDSAMMARSGKNSTIFMHCLPAERGREVTDEVMESSQSVVFHQAENRMHMQMAILWQLMKGKGKGSMYN